MLCAHVCFERALQTVFGMTHSDGEETRLGQCLPNVLCTMYLQCYRGLSFLVSLFHRFSSIAVSRSVRASKSSRDWHTRVVCLRIFFFFSGNHWTIVVRRRRRRPSVAFSEEQTSPRTTSAADTAGHYSCFSLSLSRVFLPIPFLMPRPNASPIYLTS